LPIIERRHKSGTITKKTRQKPPDGWIKFTVDASFLKKENAWCMGCGFAGSYR
jgi:hypothetical protein